MKIGIISRNYINIILFFKIFNFSLISSFLQIYIKDTLQKTVDTGRINSIQNGRSSVEEEGSVVKKSTGGTGGTS